MNTNNTQQHPSRPPEPPTDPLKPYRTRIAEGINREQILSAISHLRTIAIGSHAGDPTQRAVDRVVDFAAAQLVLIDIEQSAAASAELPNAPPDKPTAPPDSDPVNHPAHYTSSEARCQQCGHPIECVDVNEHMTGNIAAAVKYLWRCDHKHPSPLEDLRKAAWYVGREIERRTRQQADQQRGGGQ